jgi:hypothetical protein
MRRMHVFALGISLLAGCSAETSTPSTSQSGGSGTKSDYVALSQTIFMGDNVTQSWPLAATPSDVITVASGVAFSFDQ